MLFQKIRYNPIPKAVSIHSSNAQIIILLGGMRSGKSSAFVPECVNEILFPKKQIWVVGIDYDKTSRFIFGANKVSGIRDYVTRFIEASGITRLIKRESNRDHELELLNGSKAVGKSVKYPDSFVAEPVDLIVLEDASSYPDSFYDKFIRPRISDTGGRILINSVPPLSESSWLTQLYNKADNVRIQSFTWGLRDNIHIGQDEVDSLIEDMPEYLRDSIIHGKIVEEDNSVFGRIKDRIFGGFVPYIDGHHYQAGLDIGKMHDRTVLTISDLTDARVVYIDRFPPKFFAAELVEARVLDGLKKYGYPNTYVDLSGIGEILRSVVEKHQFLIPFVISSNKIRNEIIEDIAIAFQRGFVIPDYNPLITELQNLELVIKSNYKIYRTRTGNYDDCIMSLGLSLRNWARKLIGGDIHPQPPVAIKGHVIEEGRHLINDTGPIDLTGEYLL